MPVTSADGQAVLDAIASHSGGWAEGAAAFVAAVIFGLWKLATRAGDEDRDKPSASSIGGTGVALLADSNPMREVASAVDDMVEEIKGLRADMRAARHDDEMRRHEDEREIASNLKRENMLLNEQMAALRTGQVRTHNTGGALLENQGAILDGLAELRKTVSDLKRQTGPYETRPKLLGE